MRVATKLYFNVYSEEGHGCMTKLVAEKHESVMDKLFPLTQPSSTEELRGTNLFHSLEGRPMMIQPSSVFMAEEVELED